MANIVHRARSGYMALRARIQGMRNKAERQGEMIARTAEVGGASFAAGLADGYLNDADIAGLPVNLAIGGALRLGSLFLSDKAAPHFSSIADGFLGAFGYRQGRELGEKAAAKGEELSLEQLRVNRAQGLNDDGTPSDREDLIGHPNQE